MKVKHLLLCLSAILLLASCRTPRELIYFQDLNGDKPIAATIAQGITIQPGDEISIIVKSKDPMLSELFNLAVVARQIGNANSTTATSQSTALYTVDSKGEIDFPVMGKIKVGGLTREQIAERIKNILIDSNLVNDPVVTVYFNNLTYSVLGEVAHPGRYAIDKDRISILDAIGAAGDLTIYGKRENVTVIREEKGQKVSYVLDLTSSKSLCSSPAFYMHQGDIIYVTPNDYRLRQSTVNGNNVYSTSFWISVASLLTSITTVVIHFLR